VGWPLSWTLLSPELAVFKRILDGTETTDEKCHDIVFAAQKGTGRP
jgi:hypothetical protein